MRLCEKCNKNPASIQIKKIVKGKQISQHLCLTCAVKMKIPILSLKKYDNQLQAFLETNADKLPCPNCNATLESIKKNNKIGCSNCYQHFSKEIDYVIKKMTTPTNTAPQKTSSIHPPHGKPMNPNQKMLMIKSDINKAINANNFELAEKLLTQLKKMEIVKNV